MAGIVFYVNDTRWRHAHGIWHLFVLGGSTAHFVTVLRFVAEPSPPRGGRGKKNGYLATGDPAPASNKNPAEAGPILLVLFEAPLNAPRAFSPPPPFSSAA